MLEAFDSLVVEEIPREETEEREEAVVVDPFNVDTYGPVSGQIMSAVKDGCR